MLIRTINLTLAAILMTIGWPIVGVLWVVTQLAIAAQYSRGLLIVRSPRIWFCMIKIQHQLKRQVGPVQAEKYWSVIVRITKEQKITSFDNMITLGIMAADLATNRPEYTPHQIKRQLTNWAIMRHHLQSPSSNMTGDLLPVISKAK